MIRKLKRKWEWSAIIKAQKPYHKIESLKAYKYIDSLDLAPEVRIALVNENDPHQGLKGICPYCEAWGEVLKRFGSYPCINAPYWKSGEDLYKAERDSHKYRPVEKKKKRKKKKDPNIVFVN